MSASISPWKRLKLSASLGKLVQPVREFFRASVFTHALGLMTPWEERPQSHAAVLRERYGDIVQQFELSEQDLSTFTLRDDRRYICPFCNCCRENISGA